MKELDYGKGYRYAHDEPDAVAEHGLPAGEPAGPAVLPADRARVRERDQTAPRRLGGDQEARPLSGERRVTGGVAVASDECTATGVGVNRQDNRRLTWSKPPDLTRRTAIGVAIAGVAAVATGAASAKTTGSTRNGACAGNRRVLFGAKDPKKLAEVYETSLGVTRVPDNYDERPWRADGGTTVVAPFKEDTPYFGDCRLQWMINFRVRDLDNMAAQLRSKGIDVQMDAEVYPNGRFARLSDPEGNPIQLWQPGGRIPAEDPGYATCASTMLTADAVGTTRVIVKPGGGQQRAGLVSRAFLTAGYRQHHHVDQLAEVRRVAFGQHELHDEQLRARLHRLAAVAEDGAALTPRSSRG